MDKLLEQSTALNLLLEALEEEQYDKQAHALVSKLNKISPQDLAAAKNELDTLSPSTHTVLYLHILLAGIDVSAASGKAVPRQLPAAVLPEGSLWPYIVQLLLECDQIQIRYCGTQFLKVVDCVALGAEQTLNYVPAIQLIHHVILRLDETSSTLTSTHRTFIRLCLLAQAYAEALDILDRPIYHIPTQQNDFQGSKEMCSSSQPTWKYLSPTTGLTHPISSRTYMEYYLLGGMCYMAMRRYRDALFFLEVVLSTPTLQNVASSIMIEAYKKWLLVGLLLDGVAPTAPKNASQTAMRHIRAIAKPYECVADAFKTNNIDRLRAEIEAGNAFWQEDGNYGLMVELFQSFRKFSILRMGKTFDALSVAEVAGRTSPSPSNVDETKAYLEGLIVSGELGAVIMGTDKGEVLRFLPASQKSEAQVETVLASQTRELGAFLAHIQNTEHRMEVSKEYIDFLKKLKKMKDEDKKNGTTNGARADDVDEDMMEEY
ncbi:hypothetical protein PV05_01698 [Exophiala xenobiotica]|uniref:COP9 signalosome complex subunit 3 n=1 Tax=Exophiala xenobiotica TaxID=348802 RepID=A0A0D2C9H3_9EURO|nr:uncharacterized protein PV05_01698 [Exophiala xenobiotica]KIW61596.1 hypothetical protein PV05_01698 [Exophiala xenobiotica]